MSADLSEQNSEIFRFIKPRNALVIFCRAPRLGQVKTRLAVTHGDALALDLYRAMLRDTFEMGRALAPEVETWAYYTPDITMVGETECIRFPRALTRYWEGPRWPQCKGDLGTKMVHIFETLRRHYYTNIVLIGSDSPDLPLERIKTAFERLQNTDLVLGPSEDGGFYLLGISRDFDPAILDGIIWSTNSVTPRLMQNLNARTPSWSFYALPAWRDVDDESDLDALHHRLFVTGSHAPHTRAFLQSEYDKA